MHTISNALVPQGNLKANTKSENQDLVAATLDKYKKPVFPPLPDLALRRQSQSHLRKELEKGFEFRLKKLSLELDTALHQVRAEGRVAGRRRAIVAALLPSAYSTGRIVPFRLKQSA